jgi:hypothetical protein
MAQGAAPAGGGPWETSMMEIPGQLGVAALDDPACLVNRRPDFVCVSVQVGFWFR